MTTIRQTQLRPFSSCARAGGMAALMAAVQVACGGQSAAAGGDVGAPAERSAQSTSVIPAGSAGLGLSSPPCPRPAPSAGAPPWHHGFERTLCARGPEGRWLVEKDLSDADGWRHFLRFKSPTGQDDFEVVVTSPTAIARRAPHELVLLDLKNGVSVYGKDGRLLWKKSHPACGAMDRMATDARGAIVFACGYSLIRMRNDGELSWQKWPFGNKHVHGPWVDERGNAYVSGAGEVASIKPDGEIGWRLSTGFNRALSRIAWNARGNMVFDTGMDQLHSDGEGMHFYYDPEPNELFEVTRDGVIVSREKHEGPPAKGWPEVLPLPEDKAHRIPN